jgi:hypothetical protein
MNARGVGRGVTAVRLDGSVLPQTVIPRLQDGRTHHVDVMMG